MKRVIAFVLLVLFCVPFGVFSAAEDKRFYVDLTQGTDGLYYANVCWEGATLSDEVSAIRFSLGYPEDKLECLSWKMGNALRAFGIKMGPQYTHSNPASFVGATIERAMTGSGVLASFTFAAKEEARGTAELELTLLEAIRLDNSDCASIFSVSGAEISLDGIDQSLPVPACQTDPSIHASLAWQSNADEPEKLYQICPVCYQTIAEKTAENTTSDPTGSEDVLLSPGSGQLPEDAEISLTPTEDIPTDEQMQQILNATGQEELEHLSTVDVRLMWNGDSLTLGEAGALMIPAPAGVQDGETVYVAVTDGDMQETYQLVCEDGKLTFSTTVFGTVWFFRATAASGGEASSSDEPSAETENGLPAVENSGETAEHTQTSEPAGEGVSGIWIALGALALAAVLAAGVTLWKKKKPADK